MNLIIIVILIPRQYSFMVAKLSLSHTMLIIRETGLGIYGNY